MLQNSKAIITGGTRGIGLAIAKKLSSQGTSVTVCSRSVKELKSALTALNQNGHPAYGICADVGKYDQCKKMVKFALKKMGRIDILVNNAGIYGPIGPLEENDLCLWQKTIEVNLMGMVYCSQLVIPVMKKQGKGKIINLCGSGVGSPHSSPRFSAYYTSKTAVAGFTEVIARELEENNIQVNAVFPGAVNTAMTDYLLKVGPEKAGKTMYENALKQKKTGGTGFEPVAKLTAFLASNDANHLTGRLLSTKWDSVERLNKEKKLSNSTYRLRRIDNALFYEKREK